MDDYVPPILGACDLGRFEVAWSLGARGSGLGRGDEFSPEGCGGSANPRARAPVFMILERGAAETCYLARHVWSVSRLDANRYFKFAVVCSA